MIHRPQNDTNEATWLGNSIFGGPLGENVETKGGNDQFCQKIRFLSKF